MVKCAVRTSTMRDLDEPSLPVVHIDTKYYEQAIWGEETGTETTLLRRPNRAHQLFSRILKSWQCFRLNSYRKLARKYPYMWRKFQLGSSVFLFSLSQLLSTDRIVISRKRVKTLHCATRRGSEEQRHWGRIECKNSIVLSPQIVVYVSIEYF